MEFARFGYNCFSPLLKHGLSKTTLPGVTHVINKRENNNNNNTSTTGSSNSNNSNNNSSESSQSSSPNHKKAYTTQQQQQHFYSKNHHKSHHHHHQHHHSTSTKKQHSTSVVDQNSFYDVLGVKKNSSDNEIRVAYKKLCLEFHPDHNPNGREQFENIHEAYQVLRDPKTRQQYDSEQTQKKYFAYFSHATASSTSSGKRASEVVETPICKMNIVEDMHQDVKFNVACSLEDLFGGKSVKFKVMRKLVCDACCGGAQSAASHEQKNSAQKNDSAQGGTAAPSSCSVCGGKILYPSRKTFTVNIQPGMHSGQSIVFMGKGNESYCQYTSNRINKTRGNVVFTLDQIPHDVFTRSGDHLFVKHSLTLTEALTGVYSFYLSHLDGRKLHVTSDDRDNMVKNGDVQCLLNEGMPKLRTPEQKGNLYIKFQVTEQSMLDQVSEKELKRMIRNMKRTLPKRFMSPSTSTTPLDSPSSLLAQPSRVHRDEARQLLPESFR